MCGTSCFDKKIELALELPHVLHGIQNARAAKGRICAPCYTARPTEPGSRTPPVADHFVLTTPNEGKTRFAL